MYAPRSQTHQIGSKKELFLISGNEDKEYKSAKVACSTMVPSVKSDDITDTDEDLETLLVQDKRSTPRKPFGNSFSRSNKPVTKQLGYSGKPQYDPIKALNMLKERQNIPGIKREPHMDAVPSGC
jgi:hypothetical protein